MRTFFLLLVTTLGFTLAAQPSERSEGPKISFTSTTIEYGKIKKGSDPLRIFNFENKGDRALIITGAQGSCGCTVPSYPKEAIAPGEKAAIEVRYDTNRIGPFNKHVTVTTNDGQQTVLTISGEVTE